MASSPSDGSAGLEVRRWANRMTALVLALLLAAIAFAFATPAGGYGTAKNMAGAVVTLVFLAAIVSVAIRKVLSRIGMTMAPGLRKAVLFGFLIVDLLVWTPVAIMGIPYVAGNAMEGTRCVRVDPKIEVTLDRLENVPTEAATHRHRYGEPIDPLALGFKEAGAEGQYSRFESKIADLPAFMLVDENGAFVDLYVQLPASFDMRDVHKRLRDPEEFRGRGFYWLHPELELRFEQREHFDSVCNSTHQRIHLQPYVPVEQIVGQSPQAPLRPISGTPLGQPIEAFPIEWKLEPVPTNEGEPKQYRTKFGRVGASGEAVELRLILGDDDRVQDWRLRFSCTEDTRSRIEIEVTRVWGTERQTTDGGLVRIYGSEQQVQLRREGAAAVVLTPL